MNLQFKGKYILRGEIFCVTGLHIGGATEGIEIGGVDNPVIKDALSEFPYVPGSSLKGKLRHLAEWSLGGHFSTSTDSNEKTSFRTCQCGKCAACLTFGTTPRPVEENQFITGPTRLTVRDAFPTDETKNKWQEWLGEGIYTEIKTENTIDRVTAEANPRPMERVPAGSAFAFEMLFDIYTPSDHDLFKHLFSAMHLLENSALGGSGSRGHGQVEFKKLQLYWRSLAYYCNGGQENPIDLPAATPKDLVNKFEKIVWLDEWPSPSTEAATS